MRVAPSGTLPSAEAVAGIPISTPPSSKPSNLRHIPSLDGLRALSIGLVLIAHLAGTRRVPFSENLTIDYLGNLGVRVFFVISGFLITTLLVKEERKTGSIDLRSFYARRILRIFPAFYTFLATVALLTALGVVSVPKTSFLVAGTFLADFLTPVWELGHIWSLSIEEQFYLFWPAALLLIPRRNLVSATLSFAVLSPLLAGGMRLSHWSVGPPLALNFGSLACGCCLALLSPEILRRVLGPISLRLLPFLLVVSAGLGFALVQGPSGMHMLGIGAVNLAIVAILYRSMQVSDSFSRLLNSRVLTFVGVRSYSLYLWQQIFLDRAGHHTWNWFPLNLLCACACGCLSYALVEQPCVRLRYWLEAQALRRTGKPAAAPVPAAS